MLLYSQRQNSLVKVDAVSLANQVRKRFANQIMTTGQKVTFEYDGNGYIVTVNQATVEGQEKSNVERGMVVYVQSFLDIFRRAFASRVFPPHVTSKLGIKYVKGMLLHGPPGTEKTPLMSKAAASWDLIST
ncbi:hypothetical protein MTR67_005936 [Solanum verrucosum]|uniref:Vesicle-fusing ATPase n=1 Tax=Solanum verrucosum TaxID=315347 RepID=A0AAF0Q260_SOLVR|nr:hypothetical protein MTR67_005936 [Solanum verrucosum]